MRDLSFHVRALLDMRSTEDERERRASFRQATTALAQASSEDVLLRSVPPEEVAAAVRVALADGLCDTLDWLPKSDAAVALYELAAGSGACPEQRELGRRLLTRLTSESAETVAVLSARMALSSAKSIRTPQARARIALVFQVPLQYNVRSGPLALALVSRRELAREWLEEYSVGSLPERRLAARILERAAREASVRAQRGDEHAMRVFAQVEPIWKRLLADRESLVWRHIAAARGLLAATDQGHFADIDAGLSDKLGVAEWRRAATSIFALAAGDAKGARRLAARLPALAQRDPGVYGAFAWGLPFAQESEPEVAEELLLRIPDTSWPQALEGLVDAFREIGSSGTVDRIREAVLGKVRAQALSVEQQEIVADLEFGQHRKGQVANALLRALAAFAEEGAAEAYGLARKALEDVPAVVAHLREDQVAAYRALRDLDVALLENNTAWNLLALGVAGNDSGKASAMLDDACDGICEWLLGDVAEGDVASGLYAKRFQALVHLADAQRTDAAVERTRRVIRTLVSLQAKHSGSMRRPILATLARALDAQTRFEKTDAAQAFMLLTSVLRHPEDFDVLAEATMSQELSHMLSRYAAFHRGMSGTVSMADKPDSIMPTAVTRPRTGMDVALMALKMLSENLVPEASAHGEALRHALSKLHASLAAIEHAPSLRAAGAPGVDALQSLDSAIASIAQLSGSARVGFGIANKQGRTSMSPAEVITAVLDGRLPTVSEKLLNQYADAVSDRVPQALASVVAGVVHRLGELPIESGGKPQAVSQSVTLPAWMPARRTLGGFYVLRSLGGGAAGSVFLANRIEERNEPDAEALALKVPDYSASASRTLSEAEFMQLFREEAAALIGLPAHRNLARFVTFDLGAKPKPILAMEYVEGTTLEDEISSRTLTMPRVITALDDVLAGLEAMHSAGIAHLDIKPSNVILRGGKEAVLVDFGLAGRKIRPGCATGSYGAPEVWGAIEGPLGPPMPADVYAFACLAFELFTAQTLIEGSSELALISKHVAHDGSPEGIKLLTDVTFGGEIGEVLFSALRRDPTKRASVKELRAAFGRLSKKLAEARWPLTL
jgi:eukaryotic-like serine/threonine-protein kinase